MRLYDDALVLRRMPWRETSLIVHFFTRDHGLLSTMARGVRSSRRSTIPLDRAALAGFHTVGIGRQARSLQSLGILTSVEIKTPRHHLFHSALALLAAQVSQETLYRFMAPGDPRPEVFQLMEWAWNMLEGGEEALAVAAICQGRLLRALGYGWRTDCCVGCGTTERLRYFSSKRGQVVCAPCAAPYAHRLFPLGTSLFAAAQQLEWTDDFIQLSKTDKGMLYRMAMATLERFSGQSRPLLSDVSFQQRVLRPVA